MGTSKGEKADIMEEENGERRQNVRFTSMREYVHRSVADDEIDDVID